jgi:hypothetical protein
VTVWISGPTGAGKTTLSHLLRATGYSVVEEKLPEQLFRAFALDPVQHCARLQEEIVRSQPGALSPIIPESCLTEALTRTPRCFVESASISPANLSRCILLLYLFFQFLIIFFQALHARVVITTRRERNCTLHQWSEFRIVDERGKVTTSD